MLSGANESSFVVNGGETGIRTLGTLRYNDFRDRPVRPLRHLSSIFYERLNNPRVDKLKDFKLSNWKDWPRRKIQIFFQLTSQVS